MIRRDNVTRQRTGLHKQRAEGLPSVSAVPRTPIEQKLAAIWSTLLRPSEIGIHDNFFALGGDSLLATRLVSRIRSEFTVEMSLSAVFRQPTLREQASAIEAETRAAGHAEEQELAELVDALDRLTDEEANRLLAEKATRVQETCHSPSDVDWPHERH